MDNDTIKAHVSSHNVHPTDCTLYTQYGLVMMLCLFGEFLVLRMYLGGTLLKEKMQTTPTNIITNEWKEGYNMACKFCMDFSCEVTRSGHSESTGQTLTLK